MFREPSEVGVEDAVTIYLLKNLCGVLFRTTNYLEISILNSYIRFF